MRLIGGIDEVGRGPLAGPVVAAAVVFNQGYFNPEIKDSKKLSAKKREYLVEVIKAKAVSWAIVAVGPRRIEQINILQATKLAMSLAAARVKADLFLVDGIVRIDSCVTQQTVIGGDNTHVEISAASIIAKVWRDKLMVKLAGKYPGYGFEKHVGYGTKAHCAAIAALGPCRIHRLSFGGVKEFVRPKSLGVAA